MYLCSRRSDCGRFFLSGRSTLGPNVYRVQLFYARLPQHQQPFNGQEDPLWHPAGLSVTHERQGEAGVTHGFHLLFTFHINRVFQATGQTHLLLLGLNAAVRQIYLQGMKKSTSICSMFKLIRDIGQTLPLQTSVAKLQRGSNVVLHFIFGECESVFKVL